MTTAQHDIDSQNLLETFSSVQGRLSGKVSGLHEENEVALVVQPHLCNCECQIHASHRARIEKPYALIDPFSDEKARVSAWGSLLSQGE